ncbi:MAG: biotin/lipoyl-binding protein [Selenomonadaceae bacterium]|nr:biotin/lipoyl-binding protein [Selenomonadaceae bacterium]
MKKYNVTVNGKMYAVEIEEVTGASKAAPAAPKAEPVKPAAAPAPKAAPAVKPAAPAPAPKKEEPAKSAVQAAEGEHAICAPMPGKIVKISVQDGDPVKKGDVLLVLEAMKMQNEITADADGVVKAVNVIPEQNVKMKEPLIILG